MKTRLLAIAFASVISLAFSAVSYAQYENDNRNRVGVRMSVYVPQSAKLRDISSVWANPMIDVNLTFDKQDRPTSMISFGWFGTDDNNSNGAKGTMIPVTATYLKYFGDNPDKSWYVGGGLGVYTTKYKTYYSSDSNTKIGINLAGGTTFGSGWYAELRYDDARVTPTDYFGDINFSGLSLCIGTHLGF